MKNKATVHFRKKSIDFDYIVTYTKVNNGFSCFVPGFNFRYFANNEQEIDTRSHRFLKGMAASHCDSDNIINLTTFTAELMKLGFMDLNRPDMFKDIVEGKRRSGSISSVFDNLPHGVMSQKQEMQIPA
jgi:hypothetical protein